LVTTGYLVERISRFAFEETASARIATTTWRGNQMLSANQVVMPGQLLLAKRQDGLSTELELAPSGMSASRLTPQQYGVYNQTYADISVDCVWQVSGSPIVTMRNLDGASTLLQNARKTTCLN
jgi:hypothetical protein